MNKNKNKIDGIGDLLGRLGGRGEALAELSEAMTSVIESLQPCEPGAKANVSLKVSITKGVSGCLKFEYEVKEKKGDRSRNSEFFYEDGNGNLFTEDPNQPTLISTVTGEVESLSQRLGGE